MMNNIKEKIILLASIALIITSLPILTAKADYLDNENEEVIYSYTEVLDYGFTVDTIVTIHNSLTFQSNRSAKSVTTSNVYKYSGQEIATISLTVNFGYDGSSSWVNSTSVSKTVASGWTYSGQSISTSGGTAHLTATLKKALITTVDVDISLSCSPTGTIT